MTQENSTEAKAESNEMKSGGQPDVQDEPMHNFYSDAFTPDQQDSINWAAGLNNLDEEIPLMRLKILSILKNDPTNHSALLMAVSVLTRMLKINNKFNAGKQHFGPTRAELILEDGTVWDPKDDTDSPDHQPADKLP